MLYYETDTTIADSHRAALRLAERCIEKFCGTHDRAQPRPRIEPVNLAKLRAEGFRIEVPDTPPVYHPLRHRSIYDRTRRGGGRQVNPRIVRAVMKLLDMERANGGKIPHGIGKKIAQRYAVHYGTLMDRLSVERAILRAKEAA